MVITADCNLNISTISFSLNDLSATVHRPRTIPIWKSPELLCTQYSHARKHMQNNLYLPLEAGINTESDRHTELMALLLQGPGTHSSVLILKQQPSLFLLLARRLHPDVYPTLWSLPVFSFPFLFLKPCFCVCLCPNSSSFPRSLCFCVFPPTLCFSLYLMQMFWPSSVNAARSNSHLPHSLIWWLFHVCCFCLMNIQRSSLTLFLSLFSSSLCSVFSLLLTGAEQIGDNAESQCGL